MNGHKSVAHNRNQATPNGKSEKGVYCVLLGCLLFALLSLQFYPIIALFLTINSLHETLYRGKSNIWAYMCDARPLQNVQLFSSSQNSLSTKREALDTIRAFCFTIIHNNSFRFFGFLFILRGLFSHFSYFLPLFFSIHIFSVF